MLEKYGLEPHPACMKVLVYIYIYIYIGLVSLFNGISAFVGYLMPKPFS